jgi:hypothetical protein
MTTINAIKTKMRIKYTYKLSVVIGGEFDAEATFKEQYEEL